MHERPSGALRFLIWYLRLEGFLAALLVVAALGAPLFSLRDLRVPGGWALAGAIAGRALAMAGWSTTYFWLAHLFAERRPIAGRLAAAALVLALAFEIATGRGLLSIAPTLVGLGLLVSVWKELDGTPIDE